MKRGAEKQLSKDDGSDDDEETQGESNGFRKADDETLARRQIRALPKRATAGTPPLPQATNGVDTPGETPSTTTTPKFGGFTGFGTAAGNTSFTFTPPSSASSSFSSPAALSSFDAKPSGSVAPSASNTAKTFASFLGNSTQPSVTPTSVFGSTPSLFGMQEQKTPPVAEKTASKAADEPQNQAAELKYFSSLRGLNDSFINAMSKALEDDPFMDISDLLQNYKALRVAIQGEFDDATRKGSNGKSVSTASSQAMSVPSVVSMPTPPSTSLFAEYGKSSTTTTTASTSTSAFPTAGGGFVPKFASASSSGSSGFSFPVASFNPPSSNATTSSTGSDSSKPASNPFSPFGSSPFGSSSSSPSVPLGKPFSFSNNSGNSTGNIFGNAGTTSATKSNSEAPSSLFGNAGKTGTLAPGASFGSTSTPIQLSPPSPSKFGGFTGFGKPPPPAGSIGNPVGFGFGSPNPVFADTSAKTSLPFGFGGGSVFGSKKDTESKGEGESAGDEGGHADDKPVNPPALIGPSPHDEEGEGEEDEETTHAIKSKAYRLKRDDEQGGPGWVELGQGVLRLKKHKDNEARRILLRNSSTGKIHINSMIYDGMKPSQSKKAVTFVGHDAGVARTYSLRLGSEEHAKELKNALEREIEFVKAKSER